MPPTPFIRVRDKVSGAEFDLAETAFREDAHTRVNAPTQYPPLERPGARRITARPAKHRTTKASESSTGAGTARASKRRTSKAGTPTPGSGTPNTEETGR